MSKKDSLLFDMGPTKIDQYGTHNVDHPWHICGCLKYPEICPQLLFTRLVMASILILNVRTKIFEGESQYDDQFCTISRGIVGSNEWIATFSILGITLENCGTHLIQKEAALHMAT